VTAATATTPSATKADLEFLVNEIRLLHTQWDCFNELFLAPGRTALRNHAQHLYAVLDLALATDIVLTISRLCDPVQMGPHENLVFQKLLADHPSLNAQLGTKVDELAAIYEAEFKPYRNRRLAHNDLECSTGPAVVNAPKVKAIKHAIELCTEIVQAIYAEVDSAWISMVPSHVPGEVTWIEAALRLVDVDRLQIKPHFEAASDERDSG
jgi:hypothetical protein